jgi:hypothetical protein
MEMRAALMADVLVGAVSRRVLGGIVAQERIAR